MIRDNQPLIDESAGGMRRSGLLQPSRGDRVVLTRNEAHHSQSQPSWLGQNMVYHYENEPVLQHKEDPACEGFHGAKNGMTPEALEMQGSLEDDK